MPVESKEDQFVNLSALKDDDLESVLVLSEFLTRFYPHYSKKGVDDDDGDVGDANANASRGGQRDQSRSRRKVVISPEDVISAIQYRRDVEQYTNLASYIETLKKPGFYDDESSVKNKHQGEKLDKILANELESVWRRMQGRISSGRMTTDEDVSKLLGTLEVRLSKSIANDTLLNSVSEKSRSQIHPSCSTLLNVPSGNYFSTILPNCSYNAEDIDIGETKEARANVGRNFGTLPVPANSLTWKELLRLSKVVGSLPTKEAIKAATKSVLTQTNFIHTDGFDPSSSKPTNLISTRKDYSNPGTETMLLHPSSILRGSDLVALWVRAQRNTAASRHLLALFDLKEVDDDFENVKPSSSKQQQQKEVIDVDEMDMDTKENGIPKEISFVADHDSYHDRGPCFHATYMGNPNKMKHRIENESKMLDKLVEWSIVNQVLFTRMFMKNKIASTDVRKTAKSSSTKPTSPSPKRGISAVSDNVSQSDQPTTKRRKVNIGISEEMMNTCQSYVLKWFGHRNQEVQRITSCSSDWIKTYLTKKYKSTDRTLVRIERRSLLGKYQSFEEFQEVVIRLIDALIACPSGVKRIEKLKKAKEDFRSLCDAFLFEEEHGRENYICSRSKIEKSDTGALMKLMREYPRPWFDEKEKCGICTATFESGEEYRTCWNCSKNVHVTCIGSEATELQPIDPQEFKGLSEVLMSAQSLPQEKPDFVANPIKWERLEIVITRTPKDGKLPPWAMGLQNTENCEETLVTTIENVLNPQRWNDDEKVGTLAKLLPMRVPHTGMIVNTISDGPGMRAGMKCGDVIVEVEGTDNQNINESVAEAQREKHVLCDINDTDVRKSLFSKQSRHLKLTVYRPSKPITQIAASYRQAIVIAQENVKNIFKDLMAERWYCAECSIDSSSHESAYDEAHLSQMVIRRLGIDECSIPFHDEIPTPLKPQHDKGDREGNCVIEIDDDSVNTERSLNESTSDELRHISLRRLDEMMKILSSEESCEQSAPFSTPPWTKKRSLKWALSSTLRKHPFRLLCSGVVLMLNQAKMNDIDKDYLQEFAKRFLQIFISWCIDCSDYCGPRRNKGPPKCAEALIAPWIHNSCAICSVYPAKDITSASCNYCFGRAEKSVPIVQEKMYKTGDATMQKSPAGNILSQTDFESHNRFLQYESFSSYVGTMLLVPVDDRLVHSVLEKARIEIDEGRRCIELIVLSFVPSELLLESFMDGLVYEEAGGDFKDRWKKAEGLFFVLPVLSYQQMQWLLQNYCSMWKDIVPSDSNILRLPGIIALTPLEFNARLRTTQSMISAVDRSVLSISSRFGENELPTMVQDAGQSENHLCEDAFSHVLNCHDSGSFSILFDTSPSALIRTPFRVTKNIAHAIDVFMSNSKSCIFLREGGSSNDLDFCGEVDNSWGNLTGSTSDRSKQGKQAPNQHLSLLKYLDGMILAKDSDAAKEGQCDVLYSDLMYWITQKKKKSMNEKKKTDMLRLDKMIESQKMSQLPICEQGSDRTIVLHRNFSLVPGVDAPIDSDEEYEPEENSAPNKSQFHGMGWGFELVRWSSEKQIVRVGRIAPNSPAYEAGMRMHDIVKSVNGLVILPTTEGRALAELLLNDEAMGSIEKFDKDSTVPYLYHAQYKKRPIYGPIVLEITRFAILTSRQCDDEVQVVSPPNHRAGRDYTTASHQTIQRRSHHSPLNGHQQIYVSAHQQKGTSPRHTRPLPSVRPAITHQPPQQYYEANHHQSEEGNNGHHLHQARSTHNYQLPHRLLPTTQHHEARIVLNESHLYSAGINDSFLTLCEIVVLLHAINLKHVQLSMRLLCPRYSLSRVNDEYVEKIKPFVEERGLSTLPQLTDTMWNDILQHDWERMRKETGPVLFEEHGAQYRTPVEKLPIDRHLESYFNRLRNRSYRPRINGGGAMRIRGGGGEAENVSAEMNGFKPGEFLSSVPAHEWIGRAVFGFYYYEGNSRRDIFGGRIISARAHTTSSQQNIAMVTVEVYHFFNQEPLSKPQHIECPHDRMLLVPGVNSGDSNDAVIQKVRDIFYFMQKNRLKFDVIGTAFNEERGGFISAKNRDDPLTKINLMKGAMRVMSDLNDSASSMLGVLVDGRIVHFFVSDPTALYLRGPSNTEQISSGQVHCASSSENTIAAFNRNAKHALKQNPPSPFIECEGRKEYCCLWGCCAKNSEDSTRNPILSFNTLEELREHNKMHHNYSSRMDVGPEYRMWTRIDDPRSIKDLCADLTSHICGRASTMCAYVSDYDYTSFTGREESFHRSCLSKAIAFKLDSVLRLREGRPDVTFLKEIIPADGILQKSVLLWSRIACLFAIENTGRYRLADLNDGPKQRFSREELSHSTDNNENEKTLLSIIETGISSDTEVVKKNLPIKFDPAICLCVSREGVEMGPRMNCHVCRHPDEIIVKSKSDSKPHGVGCSLVTDLCYAGFENAIRNKLHFALKTILPIKGEIDMLKVLLIRLAANIPPTLYASTISLSGEHFWDGELLDTWIQFVSRCTNIRMVFQSFATLQYSLNKTRLPKWWKAKYCGWSSAPTSISTPTSSNLSLIILTLDIAVAEYIAHTKKPYECHRPAPQRRDSDRLSPTIGDDEGKEIAASPAKSDDGEWQPAEEEEDEEAEESPTVAAPDGEELTEAYKAAVAEIKRKIRRMPPKERFSVLSSWGKSWKIPVHQGDWDDDCHLCGMGGDLLCCEYCQNVAHQTCIGYKGNLDDIVFICDECTGDFAELNHKYSMRGKKSD